MMSNESFTLASATTLDIAPVTLPLDRIGGGEPIQTVPFRTTRPSLAILGTRGIPARHGGFETFAERLALYLAGRGWSITVYCQDERRGETREEFYNGVRCVRIAEPRQGALGTIIFDLKSTRMAAREDSLILTLGYNTGLFFANIACTAR